MNKLEEIGFYTLSNDRAKNTSSKSRLSRCEILLTGRCNFKCPYCRGIGGEDKKFEDVKKIIDFWISQNLFAIRFSGGEPTLYNGLNNLIKICKDGGIEKIAISTNGSANIDLYRDLINCGVNDFSISLDACCSEDGDKMSGGIKGSFDTVISNIKEISKIVYTTVGVVLTDYNINKINNIVKFADSLGVSDIRVITAAQKSDKLCDVEIDEHILNKYPILKYRINNIKNNRKIRGLTVLDSNRCSLVLDDMAICDNYHYPCIIYLREKGDPIGSVNGDIRDDREKWFKEHNTFSDPICNKNCLDVCVDYNNICRSFSKDKR